MQVSEIFYTLQGEGANIGKPAIFLRLSGCHLRCVWCDSKFTWDMKSGKQMSTDNIIKKIKKYPCKHLVITGGEPLIQQNTLKELLQKLKPEYFVEMETSGSLQSMIHEYIDQYNCSPKLSNSKNKRLVLEKFPAEKTYYKFVVDSQKDLKEIKALIKKHDLDCEKIILMPQGINKSELAKKSQWLAEICKKENLRFTPRLHIDLWGYKRGV